MNLTDLVYAGVPLGAVGLLCGGIVAAVCGLRRAYLDQTAPAAADWLPVDEQGGQLMWLDPLPSGLIGGHEDTPLDEHELHDLNPGTGAAAPYDQEADQ